MTYPPHGAKAPFDPAEDVDPVHAKLIARTRRMMLISGATSAFGIAAILGVIGYRVLTNGGSAPAPDVTTLLPKGAKIIGTTVAADRIAVVIEAGGSVEVRTFDLRTLKAAGRLKFAAEP